MSGVLSTGLLISVNLVVECLLYYVNRINTMPYYDGSPVNTVMLLIYLSFLVPYMLNLDLLFSEERQK